ncbi:DNA-binding transcriptional LysR family regulator [Simiduia aestuariiviva]|uniref:DNA-binding transcriptional LysR family regulator n=1 Tax=Simiduia aestuariiviva TaxID=1510459 RepID=A0A839USF4_9GAMM|nr:DNA-binding transcriptional LysR family regulator [Simiduia aestuariiviva]
MSQHVSKLEAHFGVALLNRQGKKFTLTDAGERLYEQAQAILLSLSSLEARVGEDPAFEGEVSIMSPGSVGLKLYPQLLGFQQVHPALAIDYRFSPNASVECALVDHRVDIGLMTCEANEAGINCQSLAEEALMLVTPKAVVDPSWEQLLALGFIDHPDGAHHARLLLTPNYPPFQHCNQFERKGFSNQIGLILEPVAMGLGFTVLPAHAVAAFQKQELLCAHRLAQPVSETIYLCWNQQKPMTNRMKSVIAELKRGLQSNGTSKDFA